MIDGLYAIGNTAANAFGHTYPAPVQRSARGWFTDTLPPTTQPRK